MPRILGEIKDACFENLASDPSSTVSGRVWNNTVEGRVKTDDGTSKRALLRNDQKAVIGNNGTANNNVRFHRGASGVLQHVLGGDATAEGTLSTALAEVSGKQENYTNAGKPTFGNAGRVIWVTDNVEPQVDTGSAWEDIIVSSGATIPAGTRTITGVVDPTNAQEAATKNYVDANSSVNGGVPVISKTANYTVLTTDQVILCSSSGGAFTITTYTAVGNTGKKITVKKTDSSTNFVTVDANSTETIDGALTFILSFQNDMVEIVSDGTNWNIVSKKIRPLVIQAHKNGGAVSATTTIPTWSEDTDTHANFNPTTGEITITRPCDLQVSFIFAATATGGSVPSIILVNGTSVISVNQGDVSNGFTSALKLLKGLVATDVITFQIGAARTATSSNIQTMISVFEVVT